MFFLDQFAHPCQAPLEELFTLAVSTPCAKRVHQNSSQLLQKKEAGK